LFFLFSSLVNLTDEVLFAPFFLCRFTEAEKGKRHPYTFMPFGYGPHNCVGMRFALLEIKLTLVKLLKKYKLERTKKTLVSLRSLLISELPG